MSTDESRVAQAVLETELPPPQKTGGAVVVPHNSSALKLQQQNYVTGSPPSDPRPVVQLRTKRVWIAVRMFIMAAVLIGWCVQFGFTFRGIEFSDFSATERAEYLKQRMAPLSLLTMALAQPASKEIGLVLSMAFVPLRLRPSLSPWVNRGTQVAAALAGYAITLPFSSLSYKQQAPEIIAKIAYTDLNQYTQAERMLDANTSEERGCTAYVFCSDEPRTDTILRLSTLPPRTKEPVCSAAPTQRGNALMSVAYGFKHNDWDSDLLERGPEQDALFTIPGAYLTDTSHDKTDFTLEEATKVEEYFTRGLYLYLDALAYQDAARGGANTEVFRLGKLEVIEYFKANGLPGALGSQTPTEHASSYVVNALKNQQLADLVGVQKDFARVYGTRHTLSNGTTFSAITMDLPIFTTKWYRKLVENNGTLIDQGTTWPGSGDVEYEIDVANECGPRTCGIKNVLLAPEPQVSAYGVCLANETDCARYRSNSSMWLFGFGRKISGTAFRLLNETTPPTVRKAVVVNPLMYHRVTFGLLEFELVDLATKFNATCLASESEGKCVGAHFPLPGGRDQLVVGVKSTPNTEFGHGFDLLNNFAPGKPLVTRYTTGAVIDYEILKPENFDTYEWPESGLTGSQCSNKMERSIAETDLNNLWIETAIQPAFTAGLSLLFHYGRRVTNVTAREGESLTFGSNETRVLAILSVSRWFACLGLAIAGALVVLVMYFVLHARAKTVPGPDELVRALVDSSTFPEQYLDVVATDRDGSNLRTLSIKSIVLQPKGAEDKPIVFNT